MLFNSQVFLFAFLPLALLGFFAAGRFSALAARLWLLGASLVFYAWWNPPFLLLLLFSGVVNYALGRVLQMDRPFPVSRRAVLWLGLAFNLLIIGYFKYLGFLVATFDGVTGAGVPVPGILLPLAISFFTFQKIAFLVDSHAGRIKDTTPLDYALFVAFFPQLIAGPIVRYEEVVPQFRDPLLARFRKENFTEGLEIFLLGLAKKVVLADALIFYANDGFDAAAQGEALTFFAAWSAALSFALGLYFDFSGYSDMAIGLGRMFNIRLPQNFNSPYRATGMVEFWRRWHMTLSRFLRDYVYIPLGGNRLGAARRYINVMLTMLIGGLWHGAGWTFVLWGGVHGAALVVNQGWRALKGPPGRGRLAAAASQALTLLVLVAAWVLFRAADLGAALRVYRGMLGFNGSLLPDRLIALLPWLRHLADGAAKVPHFAGSTVMGTFEIGALLALGTGIVLLAPNIQQMSPRRRLVLIVLSFAFTLQAVLFAGSVHPFVYFQF